jgi:hypothetical protein
VVTSSPVVLDLDIEVTADEARRYLGYPAHHEASARACDRLAVLWPQALSLLSPRGAYAVVDRDQAAGTGMSGPAERVGVGVCTVGPGIEDESGRCAAAGALLDALVLDALGSAAAEAAADALNLELCVVARSWGLEAAPRLSPGYGDWDTACQRALLALLPIGKLGLRLTTGAMMVPRKSVSFAVNFEAQGGAATHAASRCERCGLLRCRHRIAAADCG